MDRNRDCHSQTHFAPWHDPLSLSLPGFCGQSGAYQNMDFLLSSNGSIEQRKLTVIHRPPTRSVDFKN